MMTTNMYTSTIPAKLNLSLAITGRRAHLHTLDMIVYPYRKLCDEVRFFPCSEIGLKKLSAQGYNGFDEDRFVRENSSKIDSILQKCGVGGSVEIVKNIPLGAGLGGSSATIAGVIECANAHLADMGKNSPLDIGFLLSLGSDVPCVLYAKPCRVQGVGEVIIPLKDDVSFDVELVVAKGGADSGECYKLYDKLFPQVISDQPLPKDVKEAIDMCRNDLYIPAKTINPQIERAYLDLKTKGYDKVMMSGSGSCVFAITNVRESKT